MTRSLKDLTPKQREWLARIQENRRTGLTVSEYAEAHDLSPHQLYTWTTRLRRLGVLDSDTSGASSRKGRRRAKPQRKATVDATSPRFSPVQIVPETTPVPLAGLRIRFANGVVVETDGTGCLDASTLTLLASLS